MLPDEFMEVAKLIANLGVAGLTLYLLKVVYYDWRKDKEAWAEKDLARDAACKVCKECHDAKVAELTDRISVVIERLKQEQIVAVEKIQGEKDEMAKNDTAMLVGLVPKLEVLADLEKKLEGRKTR